MRPFLITFLFPFCLYGSLYAQTNDTTWSNAVWARIEPTLYAGDFAQGQHIAELALDTARQHFGPESAPYADVLYFLGITHQTQDNYAALVTSSQECLRIRRKLFGARNSQVALALSQLAFAQFRLGNYDGVETMLTESRQILMDLGMAQSDDMAETATNLASYYEIQGYYLKAEPLHLEALRTEVALHGDQRFAYSTYANNLAVFYSEVQRFDQAVHYYDLALTNMEMHIGKEHPDYVLTLKNKGQMLVSAGRYQEAESILKATLASARTMLPAGDPELSYYQIGLANLYEMIGRTDDAIQLREDALQLYKAHYGEDNPRYHSALLRFAILLESDDRPQADIVLQEVLRLLEKNKQEQTILYANAEVQLARSEQHRGHLTEARALLEKAALLGEQINGKDDSEYHWSFGLPLIKQNLLQNRPDEALRLLDAAWPILLATYGPDHERTIALEGFYGRAWQLRGDARQALEHFQTAFAILQHNFSENFAFLSVEERENFAHSFEGYQAAFLSFARAFPTDAGVQSFSYDLALFYKEMLASYDRQLLSEWQRNPDSLYQQYVAVRQMIAAQWTLPASERRDLQTLENQKGELEKRLAHIPEDLSGVSTPSKLQQAHWQAVQRMLQPGDAALEWLRLPSASLDPGGDCYAVLLLRPAPAVPELVLLPEVVRVDSLFAARGTRGLQYASRTYMGSALYQTLWQPLAHHLTGIKRIFYAPSGTLHLLNFDAIALPDATLLGEKYQLVRVANTAQLLDPGFGRDLTATRHALLVGGLDYDLAAAASAGPASSTATVGEALWRGSGGAKNWSGLPQTRLEVEQLSALLAQKKINTAVLTGVQGSEAAIKNRCAGEKAPGILHFATHGFFFEKPAGPVEGRGMTTAENPMFRSGLILSGANPAWRGDSSVVATNGNDGILTAEEVSLFDLRHTDLVVLSACETGLGDVHDEEGVYGLQRAFRLAGARNIIMSLWRVPDAPTRMFMEKFYAALLEKGAVRTAFAKAQQDMRRAYSNPYYWAGFILME